jgi:type I restriction enzyme S subunit
MQSNYKPIGNYIQPIKVRNNDLRAKDLLGINIDKFFMPSVANVVGTDLTNYKVVLKNHFACNLMHVGRDKRIPISMSDKDYPFMVSPAYEVFEIKDTKKLLPEYAMMWFRRAEYDRYAWFQTDADVRGGLPRKSFLEMKIPIPPIARQREIVAQYNAVQNRINQNNQLIAKLEETAQAVYKEWFVDGVDRENLPEGWNIKPFTNVVKLSGGGTPDTSNDLYWNGKYPFFTPSDITNGYYCISTEKTISELGLKNSSTKLYPKNTVFVTARGTVGAIALAGKDMTMNQTNYAISGKYPFFVHQLTIETIRTLKNEAVGAVFAALVTKDFDAQNVICPTEKAQEEFHQKIQPLYDLIFLKSQESQKLEQLKTLLLSRMASIEKNSTFVVENNRVFTGRNTNVATI